MIRKFVGKKYGTICILHVKVDSLLWFAHFDMRICGGAQLFNYSFVVDHTSIHSFSR